MRLKNVELVVKKDNTIGSYYIGINNAIEMYTDKDIERAVGLNCEEYSDVLKSCDAYLPSGYVDYYFKNKDDADRAIIILEKYLIMENLIK